MDTDKKTIGIRRDNNETLQRLLLDGQFNSELDAAKFAMAHAIKKGAEPGRVDGIDTKWNVGSVDADGNLRTLLEAFYPDVNEPFRLMEFLMNKGLSELAGSTGQKLDVYGILFEE